MALMQPQRASTEPSGRAPGATHVETIEELFMALESPLLAYAIRFVGQVELAEDIVQEAFMRLHAQFEEVREPKKWLYRTVHNLALNHQRDSEEDRFAGIEARRCGGKSRYRRSAAVAG